MIKPLSPDVTFDFMDVLWHLCLHKPHMEYYINTAK